MNDKKRPGKKVRVRERERKEEEENMKKGDKRKGRKGRECEEQKMIGMKKEARKERKSRRIWKKKGEFSEWVRPGKTGIYFKKI
jgi:hypothetical protein